MVYITKHNKKYLTKLHFLISILMMRNNHTNPFTSFLKSAHNDVYLLRWQSCAPEAWKIGTLKTLMLRA